MSADFQAQVRKAALALRAGAVVAYPSETVWGLAAHPDSREGVARLRALKERGPERAFQLSCASLEEARDLVEPSPELDALAVFLPGPLSVVAPARAGLGATFALNGRVGLRVPDHPVALALLRAVGGVLVTTSCNRQGEVAATTFEEARAVGLADRVLPDGGVRSLGLASTIVQLPEGVILREGAVPARTVRATLGGADVG